MTSQVRIGPSGPQENPFSLTESSLSDPYSLLHILKLFSGVKPPVPNVTLPSSSCSDLLSQRTLSRTSFLPYWHANLPHTELLSGEKEIALESTQKTQTEIHIM